jgi:hypothetical protein
MDVECKENAPCGAPLYKTAGAAQMTPATLTLRPFASACFVEFGDVYVGHSVTKQIVLHNPLPDRQAVTVLPLSKGSYLEYDGGQRTFQVEPAESVSVELRWTPEAAGGLRQLCSVKLGGRSALQFTACGSAMLAGSGIKPRRRRAPLGALTHQQARSSAALPRHQGSGGGDVAQRQQLSGGVSDGGGRSASTINEESSECSAVLCVLRACWSGPSGSGADALGQRTAAELVGRLSALTASPDEAAAFLDAGVMRLLAPAVSGKDRALRHKALQALGRLASAPLCCERLSSEAVPLLVSAATEEQALTATLSPGCTGSGGARAVITCEALAAATVALRYFAACEATRGDICAAAEALPMLLRLCSRAELADGSGMDARRAASGVLYSLSCSGESRRSVLGQPDAKRTLLALTEDLDPILRRNASKALLVCRCFGS